MTSTFLTSPLDVVKTRLQSDYYKNQLNARRAEAAAKNLGLARQGLQHFRETFQILRCLPSFPNPTMARDEKT